MLNIEHVHLLTADVPKMLLSTQKIIIDWKNTSIEKIQSFSAGNFRRNATPLYCKLAFYIKNSPLPSWITFETILIELVAFSFSENWWFFRGETIDNNHLLSYFILGTSSEKHQSRFDKFVFYTRYIQYFFDENVTLSILIFMQVQAKL